MHVPPNNANGTAAAIAVLIAIAAWIGMRYWRTALRVIVVVLIALAVYGVVVGIDTMTPQVANHNH
jgi:hypothetical protein